MSPLLARSRSRARSLYSHSACCAIVDRLRAETQKALAVPAVKERLATFGVEPMPMTADEFGKFYRDDVAATVKLARDVNLVPTN